MNLMMRRRAMLAGFLKTLQTATGIIATFVTNLALPLHRVIIPFTPVQEGTGAPGPENVRNAIGANGCTIYNNKVPEEYQEVEYIGSDGSAYIDSGIECTGDLAVEFAFSASTNVNAALCGGIIAGGSATFRHHCSPYYSSGSNNLYWCQNDRKNAPSISRNFSTNTKYEVYINPVTGIARINGAEKSFTPLSSDLTTGKNYGIFARISETGEIQSRPSRAYYFRFFRNNVLIGEFIPCYRKSDSVIGMFDTVTKTFFTNAGTDTFTKGNDVTGGESLSVSFADPDTEEPRTFSGGTFTLNDNGSADVTVEWRRVTFPADGSSWSYQSGGEGQGTYWGAMSKNISSYPCIAATPGAGDVNGLFNMGGWQSSPSGSWRAYAINKTELRVVLISDAAPLNSKANIMAFLSTLSDTIEVVYKLETPLTAHFDNIGRLLALKGTNNVRSDLNGEVTVQYWK